MWKYYAAQGKWYIILIDKTIQTRWDLCLRFKEEIWWIV